MENKHLPNNRRNCNKKEVQGRRCCQVATNCREMARFCIVGVSCKFHATRRLGLLRVAIANAPDLSGTSLVDIPTRPVAAT